MPLPFAAPVQNGFEAEFAGVRTETVVSENREREEDFGLLVERYTRLMFRVAFSLLPSAQDSEDAVQEAFLKLYRGDAWRRMENEKAFLARTVWRVALDRLSRGREQSLEDGSTAEFVSDGESPEASALRTAQAALLRSMIDALPEELRRVLLLSAIEEFNSREIGADRNT